MKRISLILVLALTAFTLASEVNDTTGLPRYSREGNVTELPDTSTSVKLEPKGPIEFYKRNMGGPRLGVTYITGNDELMDKLEEKDMGQTMSQFGWHFEYAIIPKGGGPSFIIEFIPLLGGVEYGTLVPSATLAMGVRLPSGIEFGMGPNGLYDGEDVNSSLVLALGKNFNYSGVSIPINLVFATNPDSNRFSVIFGYAIAK